MAVELDDAGHLAESDWANLRQVGSRLSDRDAGLLTEALGILNWHTSNRFSPRTGEPTVSEKGGWVRRDPVSGGEVFPRTAALTTTFAWHGERHGGHRRPHRNFRTGTVNPTEVFPRTPALTATVAPAQCTVERCARPLLR